MARVGWDRLAMAAVGGAVVGFFVGYAVNWRAPGAAASNAGGAAPVSVAAGGVRPVDAKPLAKLDPPPPALGAAKPKVLIQEFSDFQ